MTTTHAQHDLCAARDLRLTQDYSQSSHQFTTVNMRYIHSSIVIHTSQAPCRTHPPGCAETGKYTFRVVIKRTEEVTPHRASSRRRSCAAHTNSETLRRGEALESRSVGSAGAGGSSVSGSDGSGDAAISPVDFQLCDFQSVISIAV